MIRLLVESLAWRLRLLRARLNIFDASRPEQLDGGGRFSGRVDGGGGGTRPQ